MIEDILLPTSSSSIPTDTLTTTTGSDDIDDEARRNLLPPDPSPEQLLSALRWTYPGDVSILIVKELDSYDDWNYCVSFDFRGGERVLLLAKVFNGVESSVYIKSLKPCLAER